MSNSFGDLKNNAQVSNALPVLARTTSANGTGVDNKLGGTKLISAIQFVGAVTGTTPTLDTKFQQSSDNSTWTDITGATFTQVTAADNVQTISFSAQKQYVRTVSTIAGTTPNFTFGVLLVEQKKHWGSPDASGFVNDPAPSYV